MTNQYLLKMKIQLCLTSRKKERTPPEQRKRSTKTKKKKKTNIFLKKFFVFIKYDWQTVFPRARAYKQKVRAAELVKLFFFHL